jgi:hypothetical protein
MMLPMQKTLLLCAILASLCAAASAAEPLSATVHFYRYRQSMGMALKPSVYCDGIQLSRAE